ncbi:tRNA A37 threonylcarbamoyladenosine dehydratase [Dethiosulfatibacter aminovorans DSM 17477]|uniref:tRNA A37 threonylcarbamoyladenosine dehydratase n=1 Tax=Dethiosulfatibacter aminovorans DSM 17477 TaxID=1121476 RepID=A0A1M6D4Z9_9FIRM|nr:tRNA threonylcarbamoyladenosine dehydratase [Dethiosulfatibacter aminovorans]SHI68279.1 tRNA A37 threonylcarbamoyladenosine dehydratase [Dethiosulfatibacter aminovorans DSM 17477]
MNPWSRLEIIYGIENVQRFRNANVMIAGLGGVGSYSAEAVCRSFVGKMTIVDFDTYDITNLNRQLHSTVENLGRSKVDVIEENILSINPDIAIKKYDCRIEEKSIEIFFKNDKVDYVIDAIDDVNAKILLIDYCLKNDIKIISCMGTGNRTNPQAFRIADIYKTFNCPLAKKMRKELKARGIKRHKVVFSEETPKKSLETGDIGSNSFVPSSAGLLLASYVINDLAECN